MTIFGAFWKRLVAWTAAIGGVYAILGVTSSSSAELLEAAPMWLGMALALAAYPAGVMAAADVMPDGRPRLRGGVAFVAGALSASAAAFALANWVGPEISAPVRPGELPSGSSATLGEMRALMDSLRAVAAAGPATPEGWLPYNHAAFHFVRRTDGLLLPSLFAGVGVLAGAMTARGAGRSLRRLVLWTLGLFLLVSTYLAGENGYELIVLRSAGPVEFAADLVLIVPGTLIVGLAVAALGGVRVTDGGVAG